MVGKGCNELDPYMLYLAFTLVGGDESGDKCIEIEYAIAMLHMDIAKDVGVMNDAPTHSL
jgi:hypothetical protein